MTVTFGKLNGYPVMHLEYKDKNGVERQFSFGLVKAKLILENLSDIEVFVKTEGGEK